MLAPDHERLALAEGDADLDDRVCVAPELVRLEEILRLQGRHATALTGGGSCLNAVGMEVAEVAARAAGENFPVGSLLFPRSLRPHVRALYCYARLVDELGDAYDGDRLAALDELEQQVDATFEGEPEWPVLRNVQPTRARVRPAARAVRAADRGEPDGPADRRVRDVGRPEVVLRPLGRSVRADGARCAAPARRSRARRCERLGLHRAAARQLPPGRAARSRAGADLPACRGPAAVRRPGARPAER